jgi:GAF domain-containing protein
MMIDGIAAQTPGATDADNGSEAELHALRRQLEREKEARRLAEQVAGQGVDELLREQREVMLLARVAVATNEASALGLAIDECLSLVARHLGWPVATMWIRRGDDPRLYPTGSWYRNPCFTGVGLADAVASRLSAPLGSLPGLVATSGAPRWFEGLGDRANWLCDENDDELGVVTALAVPVWWRSEVVGVVALFSDEPMAPDAHSLELVEQVVTQVGAVVRRFSPEAIVDLTSSGSAESTSPDPSTLGDVAHHVRTPLNGLIGNLELLCEGGLSSESRDLATRALQSAVDLHRRFESWLVDVEESASETAEAETA